MEKPLLNENGMRDCPHAHPRRHGRQFLPAMRKMIDFYGLTGQLTKTSIAATRKVSGFVE
jgi:hypothetical protein